MVLDHGAVTEFNEKPQATEGFINGGFFVLDARKIWSFVGDDPGTVFEREPLQKLAKERQLVAFPHTGFWQPMDTAREYGLLNDLWAAGKAPWKTW
jgi:glucose-1-phosphate cytidylyltransferase